MKYRHWSYMLAIEQEIITVSRFVEIDGSNNATFSTELTKLILSICSEIDVTIKLLCEKINQKEWQLANNELKNGQKPDIDICEKIICKTIPSISEIKIHLSGYDYSIIPWKNITKEYPVSWWSEHNHLKHERNNHYKFGNLKNALRSFAGLLVVLLYYYGADGSLPLNNTNTTKLFIIPREFIAGGINWSTGTIVLPTKCQPQ